MDDSKPLPTYLNRHVKNTIDEIKRKRKFNQVCYTYLSEVSDDPKHLYEFARIMCKNLINLISEKRNENIIEAFKGIKNSGILLDGFLTGLYEENLAAKNVVNGFTNMINDQLSTQDWSKLHNPTILKYPYHDGSYGFCIVNVVFSQSTPKEIAESDYMNIRNLDQVNRLSPKAAANFVGAILGSNSSNAKITMDMFVQSHNLINALFTGQSDPEMLHTILQLCVNSDPNYIQHITQAWNSIKSVHKESILPFITYAVIPFVDSIDDDFLHNVINDQEFPSDNPNFPYKEFVASTKCRAYVNTRVAINLCQFNIPSDILEDCMQSAIATSSATDFLMALFASPTESLPRTQPLFISIAASGILGPDELAVCVMRCINSYPETVCQMLIAAMHHPDTVYIVIEGSIFRSVVDLLCTAPQAALETLSISARSSRSLGFWEETQGASIIADEIIEGRPAADACEAFIVELASYACPEVVAHFAPVVAATPLYAQFVEKCKERFHGEPVMEVIEQYEEMEM